MELWYRDHRILGVWDRKVRYLSPNLGPPEPTCMVPWPTESCPSWSRSDPMFTENRRFDLLSGRVFMQIFETSRKEALAWLNKIWSRHKKKARTTYLSRCYIVIYISQGLFGAQAPALKPVEAPKHDRRRKKKKSGVFWIFGEVTYQNPPNTDTFSEGIIQKTEKWHFGDHRIWGGSVSELHKDSGSAVLRRQNPCSPHCGT
jgi:hypothetical protein